MLRLVHPSPKGKISARPKGRKSNALTPTAEEQNRIRAAIRNLSRAYGGQDVLAEVMGIRLSLLKARRTKSFTLAILLARAAGIPVETILSGQPRVVGACSVCGRKGAK